VECRFEEERGAHLSIEKEGGSIFAPTLPSGGVGRWKKGRKILDSDELLVPERGERRAVASTIRTKPISYYEKRNVFWAARTGKTCDEAEEEREGAPQEENDRKLS